MRFPERYISSYLRRNSVHGYLHPFGAEVIAALEAEGQEAARRAIDSFVELCPSQADSRLGKHDRVARSEPPRGLAQDSPNRETVNPRC